MTRPAGTAPGSVAFALAWIITAAIARLTGAVAVLIVLVVSLVALAASAVAGWARLRGARPTARAATPAATVGEPAAVMVEGVPPGATVVVRDRGIEVGRGAGNRVDVVFARRGVVDALEVELRSAGAPGLVWWRRAVRVPIDPLVVAPRPAGPGARVEVRPTEARGLTASMGTALPGTGELDGVRAWRDGDSERAVHWPTTIRVRELVVRDQREGSAADRVVRADAAAADPELEAGRVRWALDAALRQGHRAFAAVGDGEPDAIPDAAAAAAWTASSPPPVPPPPGRTAAQAVADWLHRDLRRRPAATDAPVTRRARWLAAAASWTSLAMLVGALAWTPGLYVVLAVAVSVGAALSLRTGRSGGPSPAWLRALLAAIALGGLVLIAARTTGVSGLLALLRGPMPEFLVLLVVLHGVEAVDRRTVRVHLAITSVVVAYATGLRVDDRVGVWLAVWGVLTVASVLALGEARRAVPRTPAALVRRAAALAIGVAVALGLLALVPIPDGPARLTLPAIIDEIRTVGAPGALSRPDGSLVVAGDPGTGTRGVLGQVGAYQGFAETLDTAVRGALSDDVVMRVRAPEPDFWRGQTFSEFDGRYWTADPAVGSPADGPDIEVPPTLGDVRPTSVEVDRFVQTYFVEVDLANLVFAAPRPVRVIFDGVVWRRPDGALRSSVTLTEGSVYTVESERADVTPAALESQGDVAARLTDLGRDALGRFLAVPPTTTQRTIDLATALASGSRSTYETVRRMEAWLAANVVYDLDAPVPPDGQDAVDHFLFDGRRGFCEQIASALTIMLRTQGVPARLAAGYLPGERDRVTGVWEVRASDAHAWVEVWFPETGWQPFDPTADVPLAGTFERGSVGGDLVGGLLDAITGNAGALGLIAVIGTIAWALARVVVRWVRRRRRGRWGVLQDRFVGAAVARGIELPATNPEIARRWCGTDAHRGAAAAELAALLDQAAFDPEWVDDDSRYAAARQLVEALD